MKIPRFREVQQLARSVPAGMKSGLLTARALSVTPHCLSSPASAVLTHLSSPGPTPTAVLPFASSQLTHRPDRPGRISFYPLPPPSASVPHPGVGAGLPLQWKPVVMTVALGALPRLALSPGGSGVELAGEGAHQECQGGDVSFTYHDMECLCCHRVLGVTLH